MSFDNGVDQVQHHAANFAALAFPVMSWIMNAPEIFTAITGFLGMIYYILIIMKLFDERRKKGNHHDEKDD